MVKGRLPFTWSLSRPAPVVVLDPCPRRRLRAPAIGEELLNRLDLLVGEIVRPGDLPVERPPVPVLGVGKAFELRPIGERERLGAAYLRQAHVRLSEVAAAEEGEELREAALHLPLEGAD